MMSGPEAHEENEDQKKQSLSDKKGERIEKKRITEEEDIEKNPDIEDPRLYSPLQEPDRPAPSERIVDENVEETDSGISPD